MSLLLVAIAQAIASAPPETIDLTVRRPCDIERESQDEIVVCSERERQESFRLSQPGIKPVAPLKAEIQLTDGVALSAETESANIGGAPSNRLMARLKIKF